MEALPPQKFQPRPWRFGRKRRRSGTEATESEGYIYFSCSTAPTRYMFRHNMYGVRAREM